MNRLIAATSPYLRQHAENPVDWWPWAPEAFVEAKRRNVPIHLSIGYAACHWCHVMARESFSDPATAERLNQGFVSIKVDREERPEVDQVYMRALHALGEQGGWPLTMFLTPDAEPFWGGTYFPPEPRWGRPSFQQILAAVSDAWRNGDAAVAQNAMALREHLNRPAAPVSGEPEAKMLDRAASGILAAWDKARGSFQGAPKFPNPVVLDVLWRAWLRTGAQPYRDAVLTTLRFLSQGGIYDHLGGGFARYSVDPSWLVPHFEKMLYDNGLLLSQLAFAYRHTEKPLFRARIVETVGWLRREMTLPGGGLASSLDADTAHEEGLTYVWRAPEIEQALGEDARGFADVYGVSAAGNWEGESILNRLAPHSQGWLGDEREADLAVMRKTLLKLRNERPQPARDDKILADWNGLAISGLAQAARAVGSTQAREAAEAAFSFVASAMTEGDRLAHSFMQGSRVFPGVATDYANMVRAALDLFSLTSDQGYLGSAESWFEAGAREHFDAESATYDLSARDAPPLIAKAVSVADEATPAATGTMAGNAATLFMLTGKQAYRSHAERVLRNLPARAAADIVGSASLQSAYDTLLRGRLAIVAGPPEAARLLTIAALEEADPALFLAAVDPQTLPSGHPAAGKRPSTTGAAMFLCDAVRCLPEIGEPAAAARALSESRRGLA